MFDFYPQGGMLTLREAAEFLPTFDPGPRAPDGETPYLRVGDARGGSIRPTAVRRRLAAAALEKPPYPVETVLLSVRGSLGRCLLLDEPCYANSAWLPLRARIEPVYLAGYLAAWSSEYFDEVRVGMTILGVRRADIEVLPVWLPPTTERAARAAQYTIAEAALQRARRAAAGKLAAYEALPSALLREAFTPRSGHRR